MRIDVDLSNYRYTILYNNNRENDVPTWTSPLSEEQQEAALASLFASLAAQNADPAYQRRKAILQMQKRRRAAKDYQNDGEIAVVKGVAYRQMIGGAA